MYLIEATVDNFLAISFIENIIKVLSVTKIIYAKTIYGVAAVPRLGWVDKFALMGLRNLQAGRVANMGK